MATYPSSAPNLFALAFPATKKDFRSSRVALRKVQDLSSNQVCQNFELSKIKS